MDLELKTNITHETNDCATYAQLQIPFIHTKTLQ